MDEVEVVESPVEATSVELHQEVESEKCSVLLEPETPLTDLVQTEPIVSQLDLTKLSYELQQGYRVYSELLADSNRNITWPFLEPVDAESLGLWDYQDKIKEPMCFSTIGKKFNDYEYTSITEVIADIRLLLANCYLYNGPDHWVSKLGQKLENILEQKLNLLNRSLRDKVTLTATMSLKSDFPIEAEMEASLGGTGRRRSGRQNYLQMLNGKNSTSLVTQLKIQEESLEKERRRQREKEKKEANQALLQELDEWESKELTKQVMDQLHSMWEVPSVGSLLYLVKSLLGIEDINLTEFELSFIYPNKSNLLARIFTALLITPHQRKSLYKKPPMKFKVWEAKLKDKVSAWYKLAEKEGIKFASVQLAIDPAFFTILGKEKNPLEEKSFLDMTLHQRVWLLKTLCDICLNRDYDIHDQVVSADFMEQRDLFLGIDSDDNSYLYFPIFQTTDVRIYKHVPHPLPTNDKEVKNKQTTPLPAAKKAGKGLDSINPARSARESRLRKRRGSPGPSPSPEPKPDEGENKNDEEPPEPVCTIEEGFSLACHGIESLRNLCEKFAERPPPPKKRGRKSRPPPPRKRCEVDLHETFVALFQELEKYEVTYSRTCNKAKIKVMKESQEPEPVEEPEAAPETGDEDWGSEQSEGSAEDAGATLDPDDEEYTVEDESRSNGDKSKAARKRKTESTETVTVQASCSIEIQTAPPRLKKRRGGEEDNTEHISMQTPPLRLKRKPRGWSPKKDEGSDAVLSALQSGMSPASVLISSLSAQASARAASVGVRKESENIQTSVETVATPVESMEWQSVAEGSSQPINPTGKSDYESSLTAKPVSQATGADANHRKRILVSPEGETHEVKAFTESTSLQTASDLHTLKTPTPRKALLADKVVTVGQSTAGLNTVTRIQGGAQQGSAEAPSPKRVVTVQGGTPKTCATAIGLKNKVMTIQGGKPAVVSVVAQTKVVPSVPASKRPNILSRSRKQIIVGGRPVNISSAGTIVQTSVVPVSVSQSSVTMLLQARPVAGSVPSSQLSMVTASSGPKIPSASKDAVTYRLTLPGATPVPAGPQPQLATSKPKVGTQEVKEQPSPAVLGSNLKPLPTGNVKAVKTPSNPGPAKGSAVTKPQTSPVPTQAKQTRIVVIPASSVGPSSPLAGLTPSLITTASGQKILGYAVVVPTGSEANVSALLNRGVAQSRSNATISTAKGNTTPASQSLGTGNRVRDHLQTAAGTSAASSIGTDTKHALGDVTHKTTSSSTSAAVASSAAPTVVTSSTAQATPRVSTPQSARSMSDPVATSTGMRGVCSGIKDSAVNTTAPHTSATVPRILTSASSQTSVYLGNTMRLVSTALPTPSTVPPSPVVVVSTANGSTSVVGTGATTLIPGIAATPMDSFTNSQSSAVITPSSTSVSSSVVNTDTSMKPTRNPLALVAPVTPTRMVISRSQTNVLSSSTNSAGPSPVEQASLLKKSPVLTPSRSKVLLDPDTPADMVNTNVMISVPTGPTLTSATTCSPHILGTPTGMETSTISQPAVVGTPGISSLVSHESQTNVSNKPTNALTRSIPVTTLSTHTHMETPRNTSNTVTTVIDSVTHVTVSNTTVGTLDSPRFISTTDISKHTSKTTATPRNSVCPSQGKDCTSTSYSVAVTEPSVTSMTCTDGQSTCTCSSTSHSGVLECRPSTNALGPHTTSPSCDKQGSLGKDSSTCKQSLSSVHDLLGSNVHSTDKNCAVPSAHDRSTNQGVSEQLVRQKDTSACPKTFTQSIPTKLPAKTLDSVPVKLCNGIAVSSAFLKSEVSSKLGQGGTLNGPTSHEPTQRADGSI